MGRNGMLHLEFDHACVGAAQPACRLQRAHGGRHLVRIELGRHCRDALGVDLGTVCDQRRIDRHEFVFVAGAPRQQDLAEVGRRVHFQEQVRKLHVADFLEHQLACPLGIDVFRQGAKGRQVQRTVGVDGEQPLGLGLRDSLKTRLDVFQQRLEERVSVRK